MQRTFAFTSTKDDLIDMHQAMLTITSGARPVFRLFLIGLGLLWTIGPIFFLVFGGATFKFEVKGLVSVIFGSLTLWKFLILPYWQKREIIKESSDQQPVVLNFTDDGIRIEAEGVGNLTRTFGEVSSVTPCNKGLALVFSDGTANWIPSRMFVNSDDIESFTNQLNTRIEQFYGIID
jgi:hypothetical protein